MEKYLALFDFSSRLPGIPAGFSVYSLSPYFQQLRDGWLGNLLPDSHAFWQADEPRDAYPDLHTAFARFAVYAIWSSYVLEGTAITTEVGQVRKQLDHSESLPSAQRAELHRKYMDLAQSAAANLTRVLATNTSTCHPVGRSQSGPSLSTIKGRTCRNSFN